VIRKDFLSAELSKASSFYAEGFSTAVNIPPLTAVGARTESIMIISLA
jgi:hypothetical protein